MKKAIVQVYESKEALGNARIKAAAQTTYSERFYTLMKLIKISSMISNAKIISAPEIKNSKS